MKALNCFYINLCDQELFCTYEQQKWKQVDSLFWFHSKRAASLLNPVKASRQPVYSQLQATCVIPRNTVKEGSHRQEKKKQAKNTEDTGERGRHLAAASR